MGPESPVGVGKPDERPVGVALYGGFLMLTVDLSLVLLAYTIIGAVRLGAWSVAIVATVGIVLALGIYYVGIADLLEAL